MYCYVLTYTESAQCKKSGGTLSEMCNYAMPEIHKREQSKAERTKESEKETLCVCVFICRPKGAHVGKKCKNRVSQKSYLILLLSLSLTHSPASQRRK
jgi:hypothetical protein